MPHLDSEHINLTHYALRITIYVLRFTQLKSIYYDYN